MATTSKGQSTMINQQKVPGEPRFNDNANFVKNACYAHC